MVVFITSSSFPTLLGGLYATSRISLFMQESMIVPSLHGDNITQHMILVGYNIIWSGLALLERVAVDQY